ncbi:hypothetical protein V6N12_070768 [Hibiscus sabdariffa]|uniref:Uncharacterized protein n=1 Tax=Hibiscus sabdariffa TaxID=183260 RepID=A0ABR2FI05_9ROSI
MESTEKINILESNLFGPWMVVESHQNLKDVVHVNNTKGVVENNPRVDENIGKVIIGRRARTEATVSKNEPYKASNLEKMSKNQSSDVRQLVVRPLVEGQVATVTPYKSGIQSGNHTTIRIQEK